MTGITGGKFIRGVRHRTSLLIALCIYAGRGGGIRTPDPLLPKQMRYQAAPRPDLPIVPRIAHFP
jgi:hypothetical protein